jgi:hypothetical protein
MRTIHNLTDVMTPSMRLGGATTRGARTLTIGGQRVAPGRSIDVPDSFRLNTITSLIADEAVSVDCLPDWYQTAKRIESEPQPMSEEVEEKPRRRKRK